jgi:hypothetical protein
VKDYKSETKNYDRKKELKIISTEAKLCGQN